MLKRGSFFGALAQTKQKNPGLCLWVLMDQVGHLESELLVLRPVFRNGRLVSSTSGGFLLPAFRDAAPGDSVASIALHILDLESAFQGLDKPLCDAAWIDSKIRAIVPVWDLALHRAPRRARDASSSTPQPSDLESTLRLGFLAEVARRKPAKEKTGPTDRVSLRLPAAPVGVKVMDEVEDSLG